MRTSRIPGGLILLALGCSSGSTGPEDPTVESIALAPATVDTLFSFGDAVQIIATPRDRSGNAVAGVTVSFQTSQPGIVSVTQEGLATAIANGVSQITASANGVNASVAVPVRQRLFRVNVQPGTAGVSVGRTVSVTATGTDFRGNAFGGPTTLSFISDNTAAATVSSAGVVTALSPGVATITVNLTSPVDGTKTATSVITVAAGPPATATVNMGASTFSPGTVEISVGGTVTWVNNSGTDHDVDFGTPTMRIPVFGTGQRALTFPAAGTFEYHCNLHSGMTGTVVVL